MARCAQCLLPLRARPLILRVGGTAESVCCYGCYLVLRITRERGPDGTAHGIALRLGLALFFAMNAMMFSLPAYFPYVYGDTGGAAEFLLVLRAMAMLLTIPVLILLGGPVLWQAGRDARQGLVRTDALVALGTIAAFGLSVHHTLTGAPHVYFDTVAMLLVFVALGRYLEACAKADAGAVLARLRDRTQQAQHVLRGGTWHTLATAEILADDVIALGPGDVSPVDGIIVAGIADFDESTLTGESLPVTKAAGTRVVSGSTNLDGTVHVRAEQVGAASTMGRIARSVEDALAEETHWQRGADRLAGVLVVTAPLLALATFAYWSRQVSVEHALLNALAVLVVACPCAFGIATPAALWVGVDEAARRNILLRSAATLERLARVRRVWFDKTGTLSSGTLDLAAIDIALEKGTSQAQALAVASVLEADVPHPIAAAIRHAAPTDASAPVAESARNVRYRAGLGVEGEVGGAHWFLGSEALMRTLGLSDRSTLETACPHAAVLDQTLTDRPGGRPSPVGAMYGCAPRAKQWSVWLARVDGNAPPQVVARFGFSDPPRAEAAAVIDDLARAGLAVGILSGAADLGDAWRHLPGNVDVRVGLLPEDKAAAVRASAGPVAMVGDGLNDAPALAAADVGIAIGTGRALTRDAAQVNVLSNDLAAVAWLFQWARRVQRTIVGNTVWALLYNAAALAAAAGGLLNPVIAALAMIGSSVFIVANARRLRGRSSQTSAVNRDVRALPMREAVSAP